MNTTNNIIKTLYQSFTTGIRNGKSVKANTYLQHLGLSIERTDALFLSGQTHHRQPDSIIEELKSIGFLTKSPQPTNTGKPGHSSFMPMSIGFALRDERHEPNNFYAISIENPRKRAFLNDNGLYPSYPKTDARRIYITADILDCATLIENRILDNKESALALFDGVLKPQHIEAIGQLNNLQEIILFNDNRIHENTYQTLQTIKDGVQVIVILLPEGETINTMVHNYEATSIEELLQEFLNGQLQVSIIEESLALTKLQTSTSGKLNTDNPARITYQMETFSFTCLSELRLDELNRLRVMLLVVHCEETITRDNIDLYNPTRVRNLIKILADSTGIAQQTVKSIVNAFITDLENYRFDILQKNSKPVPVVQMTKEEEAAAIAYLKQPDLMQRTQASIAQSGVIGRETEVLLTKMVFTSRKVPNPSHLYTLGESGIGKSYLQKGIAALIPSEDKLEFTTLTKNSFFLLKEKELNGKLLLIEDLDGVNNAEFAIRELQTAGKITKLATKRNNKGELETVAYTVEGQVSIAGTTTKQQLYEDNANRAFLIHLEIDLEQEKAVLDYQCRLSAGLIDKEKEEQAKCEMQNVQRMLNPVNVRNPLAMEFKLPTCIDNPIRANANFLSFIEVITFYHQYQRELKTDEKTGEQYIETTVEDLEWTFKLLKKSLITKSDILPQAVRTYFERIKANMKAHKQSTFLGNIFSKEPGHKHSNAGRYIDTLRKVGYILQTDGNRKDGHEYELTGNDSYAQIEQAISSMEKDLERLKLSFPLSRRKK